jgi:hypothetical protein
MSTTAADSGCDLAALVEAVTGPRGPEARLAEEIAERRVEYDAIADLLTSQATRGIGRDEMLRVARGRRGLPRPAAFVA